MKATRWFVLGVGCLAIALTSCSGSKTPTTATAPPPPPPPDNKPQSLILGKWMPTQPGRENETIEFAKNGTLSGPGISDGTYKFIDNTTIEYKMKLVLNQQFTKAKVKVGKDDLTLDIVEAKSRPDDGAEWGISPDDMERKGKQEKYKRVP